MPGDRFVFALRDSHSIPSPSGGSGCLVHRVAHERWGRGMQLERDHVGIVALLLVQQGGGLYRSAGRSWRLKPADLFAFGPGHAATVSVDRNPGMDLLIVACSGEHVAQRIGADLGQLEHPRRIANPSEAAAVMEAMLRQLSERRPHGRELCQRYLPVLLGVLRQGLEQAEPSAPARASWLQARDWIARHAAEATVAAAASACGISPEHLNRLYRRHAGIRAHEAIARARLSAAAERLLASDDSLAEIAADFGYANAFSFSRAFHRTMGMPPSRWRREAR